jgi:hypothetical protein
MLRVKDVSEDARVADEETLGDINRFDVIADVDLIVRSARRQLRYDGQLPYSKSPVKVDMNTHSYRSFTSRGMAALMKGKFVNVEVMGVDGGVALPQ